MNFNSLRLRPTTTLSGIWLITLAAWASSSLAPLRGQDPFSDPGGQTETVVDPFGTPPAGTPAGGVPFGGFGQPAVEKPADPALAASALETLDADPVVRLLRAEPPETPETMAQALTWMTRIKRWDEVRSLLDQLSAANWSLEQQAALAREAGPALWLRVQTGDAELSEAQQQVVADVASAPAKLARDPQWLDRWIAELASPVAAGRRLAQLRLQDGGLEAIQRLVGQLLAGETSIDAGLLAGTIREFGPEGIEALQAACLVGDPERAARVFLALAELPGSDFTAELAGALSSQILPQAAHDALAERLMTKYGRLPSADAIREYLAKRFEQELAEYQLDRGQKSVVQIPVWRPTADGLSIRSQMVASPQAQLESLARIAAHRLRSNTALPGDRVDCGAVALQRAYHLQPGMELGEIDAHLIADFPEQDAGRAEYWIQVIEQADEWQMHGGALRGLQMLIQSSQGSYLVPLEFLSGLLDDSRPLIRYAALRSIDVVDPQMSFSGAEQALETAVEMLQLGSGPQVLVIGLQSELRQVAARQLQLQTGAEVVSANSASSALLALDGSAPIEMIVVVDRVADQSLYELIQRLRNSEKGRALPIAVLTDQLYQHERRLIAESPGILASVLSQNPEQMQRVVARMLETLDTAALSAVERQAFSSVASRFLNRLAADRQTYAFYPLMDWSKKLTTLGSAESLDSQLVLLSGLASPDSQRQLVTLASQPGISKQHRLQAARAFGQSVRRSGMNLNRKDVLQAYELYNTLGPDDPVAAQALGLILDVLEAHAGRADWPEGL